MKVPARGSIVVAAAVVWRHGRVLMTRRPPGGPLGLRWEFPGGKIEPGESAEDAVVRELREELGVGAAPLPHRDTVITRFRYPHGIAVTIHFVPCELDSIEFTPSPAVREIGWVRPSEMDPGEVLEADRPFLASLVDLEEGAG